MGYINWIIWGFYLNIKVSILGDFFEGWCLRIIEEIENKNLMNLDCFFWVCILISKVFINE